MVTAFAVPNVSHDYVYSCFLTQLEEQNLRRTYLHPQLTSVRHRKWGNKARVTLVFSVLESLDKLVEVRSGQSNAVAWQTSLRLSRDPRAEKTSMTLA